MPGKGRARGRGKGGQIDETKHTIVFEVFCGDLGKGIHFSSSPVPRAAGGSGQDEVANAVMVETENELTHVLRLTLSRSVSTAAPPPGHPPPPLQQILVGGTMPSCHRAATR
mgnify:CR=1 FL=1